MRILKSAVLVASLAFATTLHAQSIQTVPPGARAPQPQSTQNAVTNTPAAPAHTPVVTKSEAERKGGSDRDIFMGVYLALDRDCKVGSGPRIEFVSNPANGKMKTRNHPINLRDVPGAPRRTCIGTSPNGVAVIYRSNKRFKGDDLVNFKAIYPNGDIRDVTVKIVVQ